MKSHKQATETPDLFPSNGAAFGSTGTILVVDDDDMVRFTASALLKCLGYSVLEASGSDEALNLLAAGQPVDLMFTDLCLPAGLNGVELAGEAQKRQPGLKVVFTTGLGNSEWNREVALVSGDRLLGKPYTLQELSRKISSALGTPQAE